MTFNLGIINGVIEPSVALDDVLDQSLDFFWISDVHCMKAGDAAGILDRLSRAFAILNVVIRDRHFRAFSSEQQRRRLSDS